MFLQAVSPGSEMGGGVHAGGLTLSHPPLLSKYIGTFDRGPMYLRQDRMYLRQDKTCTSIGAYVPSTGQIVYFDRGPMYLR